MGAIKDDMKPGAIHKSNNYGLVEIICFHNKSKVDIHFLDTGAVTSSIPQNIREGRVKDRTVPSVHGVGYIGFGEHKSSFNGNRTPAYIAWWGILDRCYSKREDGRYSTYSGCIVCDEWHNFQNFADWYTANKPNTGEYEIDKDIKSGNKRGKVYSPTTCVFVSAKINSTHANAIRFKIKSPNGEVLSTSNLTDFCKKNKLDPSALSKVISGKANHHKQWRKA